MSIRIKSVLVVAGLTIGCASCASTCGEDEQKPQTVKVGSVPARTGMSKGPRGFLAAQAAQDASATPPAP